jgi:hypothetical protein
MKETTVHADGIISVFDNARVEVQINRRDGVASVYGEQRVASNKSQCLSPIAATTAAREVLNMKTAKEAR